MVGLKATLALSALLAPTAQAVNVLKVQGSNFVDTVTNQRFEIIGVDYQPGGSAGFDPTAKADPLTNGTACLRDAVVMQNLGLNCIRVYNLDPSVSHDECASIFNAAGIYMVIDVNSPLPNESLDAGQPWNSYNMDYLKRVFGVVEAFKGYDNLLGFFGGNEVVNDMSSGRIDPPYVRAVVRDLKSYVAKNAPRAIPVGYSAADVREILVDTWQYLQCALNGQNNDPSRIDFFGLNSYSWCGADATFQTSGYDVLTADFARTTVPVFFSEYGCNKVVPGSARPFTEIQALYGAQMRAVMSGGLVYEWTQETNDFGLVKLNGGNGSVSLLNDFDALQGQLNKVDLKGVQALNATATALTPPKCTPSLIRDSSFSRNFTVPPAPQGVQGMIDDGVDGFATGKLNGQLQSTDMPVAVYGSNGQEIRGLKLNVTSSANAPNGGSASGGGGGTTGSGTAPASSSSSGMAAPTSVPVQGAARLVAAGLMGLALL